MSNWEASPVADAGGEPIPPWRGFAMVACGVGEEQSKYIQDWLRCKEPLPVTRGDIFSIFSKVSQFAQES